MADHFKLGDKVRWFEGGKKDRFRADAIGTITTVLDDPQSYIIMTKAGKEILVTPKEIERV